MKSLNNLNLLMHNLGIDETVGNSPVRKMSLNGKYLINLYLLNHTAMNIFNRF